MKTPFIWLGSKRAKKRGVGPLGFRLDEAAKAGLPVANGAILQHEFYQLLLDEGLIQWQNGRFHADNPLEIHDALYTAVRFPQLTTPVTVRPAFESLQKPPTVLQNIQFTDASQLTNALCIMWNDGGPPTSDMRRDVLVQETVSSQFHGIAISKPTESFDQVDYAHVNADTTQTTLNFDQRLQIPRLRRWQAPEKSLPAFAQRLQNLLRGMRRTFGDESWQIEWIDNGRICQLNQIDEI